MNISKLEKIILSKKTTLAICSAALILGSSSIIGIKKNNEVVSQASENLKSIEIQLETSNLNAKWFDYAQQWLDYSRELLDDSERYGFIPFYIAFKDRVLNAYERPIPNHDNFGQIIY